MWSGAARAEARTREIEAKLVHYERVELALQEALESARETARSTAASAEEKARLIIQEAELRAETILRDAERGIDYHFAPHLAAPLLDMQHPDTLGAGRVRSLQPSAIPLNPTGEKGDASRPD